MRATRTRVSFPGKFHQILAKDMRLILILLICTLVGCKPTPNTKEAALKKLPDGKVMDVDTLRYTRNEGYKLLPSGLYKNDSGEIAFRTVAKYTELDPDSNYHDVFYENFINRIHTQVEEIDGGPQFMKNVVDVNSFKRLGGQYFADEKNVYYFWSNSDGGAIRLVDDADVKTFIPLDSSYGIVKDRNYFYRYGRRLSKEEIKLDSLLRFKLLGRKFY